MTTSRERVEAALAHREADQVPLDLGGSGVTGMHVDSVYKLRQALKLDPPGTPVKVVEPLLQLGEIAPDLIDVLGVDVVSLGSPQTIFGFRNEGWKNWMTFAGTPVLVPEGFNTEPEPNGDIFDVSLRGQVGGALRPYATRGPLSRCLNAPGSDR